MKITTITLRIDMKVATITLAIALALLAVVTHSFYQQTQSLENKLEDAEVSIGRVEEELAIQEKCHAAAYSLMVDVESLVVDLYDYGDDSLFWADLDTTADGIEKYESSCQPEKGMGI
jgi:hypothetical protein